MATKTKKTPAKKTATKKTATKKTTVKAKAAKKEQKPVVEVWLEESYVHYMSKGPILISAETHPELEGMTLEEMKEYIQENKYDMAPIDNDYAENIIDELKEYDTVKDKYLDENEDIFFNN
jgi:hypothetical protein